MLRKPTPAMSRFLVLVGVVSALGVIGGCARCKEWEQRVASMDTQMTDLQSQVAQKEATIAECNGLVEELRANIKAAGQERDSLVARLEEEIVIQLPEELVFGSNSDVVLDTMVPTLRAIAETIKQHPGWMVYVQGYTDNKFVPEDLQYKWADGWDVAAARACAVVRYMTGYLEVSPDLIACVSYGAMRPPIPAPEGEVKPAERRVTVLLHKVNHGRGPAVD